MYGGPQVKTRVVRDSRVIAQDDGSGEGIDVRWAQPFAFRRRRPRWEVGGSEGHRCGEGVLEW